MDWKMPNDDLLTCETARLTLEPMRIGHLEEMWELFGDERMHVFIPFQRGDRDDHRARTERWSARVSKRTGEATLNWVARERSTGVAIAHFQAGFSDLPYATIGYMVAVRWQNRGFAAEGISEIVRLVGELFQIREVRAWIDTRNAASIRMVEKIGFRKIETILNADHFHGAPSDEFVYCLETPKEN